jgi:AcrR family transcriptional regulator
MARRSRLRLEVDARRLQLIAKGIELFGARGYDDVSIDELAKELGISKGLLYHYFPTKRDYWISVLEAASSSLIDATEVDASLPPEVRLERGLDAYLTFVQAYAPAYVALLRGGAEPSVAAVVARTRQRFVDRIVGEVAGAGELPTLRLALRGWVGFVETVSLEWLEKKEVTKEAVVALAKATFFATLAAV